jgi:hypothetical protein
MSAASKKPLQISHAEFEAALRLLDGYVFVELREMPKDFLTYSQAATMQGNPAPPSVAVTVRTSLLEIAEFLWKSFCEPQKVDRIHAETYAENQVEFFKSLYVSVAKVSADLNDEFSYGELDSPVNIFMQLSQPAQMIIIRDNLLNEAMSVWRDAEEKNYREKEF